MVMTAIASHCAAAGQLEYAAISKRFVESFFRLKALLQNDTSFEFVKFSKLGDTLLVGEGNLSFAVSLSSLLGSSRINLVATTYDARNSLSKHALANASNLKRSGVSVMHEVDATKLHEHFGKRKFRLIAFQFPNVASRVPVYGRNPNHILVRRFLRSARSYVGPAGLVAITVVNSPHYDGAFDMAGASIKAGFHAPETYPFYFDEYPGYSHGKTVDETESAVENEDAFVTFVFWPKK
jgi:25S rRNA (uracil2634-N3)-methyltransferase